MQANKIAVVGGGISGLVTAYYLLKKGYQVTLFEKEAELGGLASTFPVKGTRLEKFYHHFFAQDTLALELIEELGLKDKFYWAFPRMGFFSKGTTYPFTTPLDLLAFPPLSLPERLKFGLFSFKVKQETDWQKLETKTAKEWLIENLGTNIYQEVWQPLLRAKFAEHADKIPAFWVWGRLKARGKSRSAFGWREKLGYLKGSYQVLIDALAAKITGLGGAIKLGQELKTFPLPGFDRTILTIPQVSQDFGLKYLGNICLIIKTKQRLSNYYWLNLADNSIPFCVIVEHNNAFDSPLYQGERFLFLSSYLDHQSDFWQLTDQELLATYLAGLQKIYPAFKREALLDYYVFREKFAQPLPTLGYSKKVPPFKINEKLYLVSNMQIYPEDRGINDTIKLICKFIEQF